MAQVKGDTARACGLALDEPKRPFGQRLQVVRGKGDPRGSLC